MRQLERDLAKETGLALADFDVLAQLALAGGALRMTELAVRALISRSGMTRRVARLVDVGLIRRATGRSGTRGSRECPGEGHPRLHVWEEAGVWCSPSRTGRE